MTTNTDEKPYYQVRRNEETGKAHLYFVSDKRGEADHDAGPISDTAIALIKAHQDAALLLMSTLRADDFFGDEEPSHLTHDRDKEETAAAVRIALHYSQSNCPADDGAIREYARDCESDDLRNLLKLPSEMIQMTAKGYAAEMREWAETREPFNVAARIDAHRKAQARCDDLASEPDEAEFEASRKREEKAAVQLAASYFAQNGLSEYQVELLDDYCRVAQDGAREGSLSYLLAMPRDMILVLAQHFGHGPSEAAQ